MPARLHQHGSTVGRAAALALAAALLVFPAVAAGAGSGCAGGLRERDQLWLVSQRGLGCDPAAAAAAMKYWRYDAERHWVRASLQEMAAADPGDLTTVVFVHGNRMSAGEAFGRGWLAYRRLSQNADDRPLRFVVWSWPSDQIRGPLEDAQVKAARTVPAAYCLAWFLDQLGAEDAVGLWGHSFGARIITGALHVLGGGTLAGTPHLARRQPGERRFEVVLAAAALDHDWLLAGHAHGRALTQVEGLLLINNRCDPVLKRYHRLYHRRACQVALGYVGLPSGRSADEGRAQVQQVDASCLVGNEHAFAGYLSSNRLMTLVRDRLLPDPRLSPPAAEAAPSQRVAER